ncbi:hypothetical protein KIL84_017285 [Mauremys mutica]|uniref:Sodium/potassium-transporting ATPase subunit beta-1-interacting protein n=1 Tax=Mauremys mutica TaxID=74926 RepID=A0A9D4AYH0_9SAUR|nr:hypothetical protein KIL84_017285 [Mauremys mutica]
MSSQSEGLMEQPIQGLKAEQQSSIAMCGLRSEDRMPVWQEEQHDQQQYAVWLVFWVTWNVFVICFYLEAGDLSKRYPGENNEEQLESAGQSDFPTGKNKEL